MPATAGLRDTLSGSSVIKIGSPAAIIGQFLIGQLVWSAGRDTIAPAPVARDVLAPTAGTRDIL